MNISICLYFCVAWLRFCDVDVSLSAEIFLEWLEFSVCGFGSTYITTAAVAATATMILNSTFCQGCVCTALQLGGDVKQPWLMRKYDVIRKTGST